MLDGSWDGVEDDDVLKKSRQELDWWSESKQKKVLNKMFIEDERLFGNLRERPAGLLFESSNKQKVDSPCDTCKMVWWLHKKLLHGVKEEGGVGGLTSIEALYYHQNTWFWHTTSQGIEDKVTQCIEQECTTNTQWAPLSSNNEKKS